MRSRRISVQSQRRFISRLFEGNTYALVTKPAERIVRHVWLDTKRASVWCAVAEAACPRHDGVCVSSRSRLVVEHGGEDDCEESEEEAGNGDEHG